MHSRLRHYDRHACMRGSVQGLAWPTRTGSLSAFAAALLAAAYAMLFCAAATTRAGTARRAIARQRRCAYFPVTLRACLDRIDICGLSLPSLFGCTLNG
jgi:hypothetical protein